VTALAVKAPWTSKVPLLTVVAPVKGLVVLRISAPLPALFKVIAPSSAPEPPKV